MSRLDRIFRRRNLEGRVLVMTTAGKLQVPLKVEFQWEVCHVTQTIVYTRVYLKPCDSQATQRFRLTPTKIID